jgi:hypothetical protein
LDAEGLPFSEILPADEIQRVFEEEDALFGEEEEDRYTAPLTLWAFLLQVMQSGVARSCNAAVERLRTLCAELEIPAPSPDSGAYCRARAKLPERALERLTYRVADGLEAQAPAAWKWCITSSNMEDACFDAFPCDSSFAALSATPSLCAPTPSQPLRHHPSASSPPDAGTTIEIPPSDSGLSSPQR